MAYIILPSRRTRQPSGPVRLRSQYLLGLADVGIGASSIIDGTAYTPFGTAPTYDAGPLGRRVNSSAAFGGVLRTLPTVPTIATQTLVFYGEVLAWSGAYAGLITTANATGTSGSLQIGRNASNNGWSISNSGSSGTLTGDPIANVGPVCLVVTSVGGSLEAYVNGKLWGSVLLQASAQTTARLVVFGERQGSASYAVKGFSYLHGSWGVAFPPALAAEISRDPYGELFVPDVRRLYFAPSGGGTTTTTIEPSKGFLAVAGYAPGIAQPRTIAPSKGASTLTGYAPGIEQDKAVAPAKGALTLTGYVPTLTQPRTIAAVKGALTLSGYAPGISQSASGTIAPSAGALLLTGHAPGLEQDRNVAPAKGALTLTGGQPGIVQNVTTFIAPSKGALALLGYTPDVTTTANQAIAPTQGALLLGGYAPVLAQTGAQIIGPIKGALTLAGYAPTVQVIGTGVTLVEPTVGALILSGYAPLVRVAVTPPRGGGYSFGTMGGAERRPPQDNAQRPS